MQMELKIIFCRGDKIFQRGSILIFQAYLPWGRHICTVGTKIAGTKCFVTEKRLAIRTKMPLIRELLYVGLIHIE